MKVAMSDDGFLGSWVEDDYEAKDGEVIFSTWPLEPELLLAFPLRFSRIEAIRLAALAKSVRAERDRLLREVYDAGAQMIRREIETIPIDTDYEAKLISKRSELHAYARLLQAVPNQAGFPETITWPTIPTSEFE